MYNAQSKWTPLHTAARQGHVTVIQTMINFGADLATTDSVRNDIHYITSCTNITVPCRINVPLCIALLSKVTFL